MSDFYGDCSDTNSTMISSPSECKFAMKHIEESYKGLVYGGEVFDSSFPKGCFFKNFESSGKFHWNHHSFGSKNVNSRQICTRDG